MCVGGGATELNVLSLFFTIGRSVSYICKYKPEMTLDIHVVIGHAAYLGRQTVRCYHKCVLTRFIFHCSNFGCFRVQLLPFALLFSSSAKGRGGMERAGLSDYAQHTLREICSQEWVREKFLKDPKALFNSELLLDKMLSHAQVRAHRNI